MVLKRELQPLLGAVTLHQGLGQYRRPHPPKHPPHPRGCVSHHRCAEGYGLPRSTQLEIERGSLTPSHLLKGKAEWEKRGCTALYSARVCMYMCWGAEIEPSPIVSPVCHSLVSSSGQSTQQILSKHRPGKPCAPGWLPGSSSVVFFCPVLWAGKQLGSLG